MDLALSLRSCLGGIGVGDDDNANGEEGEGVGDEEDEEGMNRKRREKKGKELCGVTKHTGQTVLGVLLGAGEALINDAETAITNSKNKAHTQQRSHSTAQRSVQYQ